MKCTHANYTQEEGDQGCPGGASGYGSGVVTVVVWVQSLAWEVLHAMGVAKKKKKKKKEGDQYNLVMLEAVEFFCASH